MELFEEIIVVSNDPLEYLKWDVQVVTDLFSCRSSLTGLHAGLFSIQTPFAFVCACDTPFLKKELVKTILAHIDHHTQVVVPKTPDGFFEPLCAVYAKTCVGPAEMQLARKKFKISDLFSLIRIKTITPETLMSDDPELISFFNVNTPEDIIKAESIQTQIV
jgi:molybdopterin-guanine dinucleotide biosynthesis protein A